MARSIFLPGTMVFGAKKLRSLNDGYPEIPEPVDFRISESNPPRNKDYPTFGIIPINNGGTREEIIRVFSSHLMDAYERDPKGNMGFWVDDNGSYQEPDPESKIKVTPNSKEFRLMCSNQQWFVVKK